LIARNPDLAEEMKAAGEVIEEPLEIDYEVAPYSPTENSKSAQLKKMQQFLEFLVQDPNVDKRKLVAHLLDTLDIGADVLVSEAELAKQAQMQMQASQMAAQEASAETGVPPGTEDTIATGGMPDGVSPIPTEAVAGMAGGAGFPTPGAGGGLI